MQKTLPSAKIQSGHIVKVGDTVSFKSDVEQSGEIVKITRDEYNPQSISLLLKPPVYGQFHGDYIGGNDFTVQDAMQCWKEG